MLDRLRTAEIRYQNIEDKLASPDVMSDIKQFTALQKELRQLTPVIEEYRRYMSFVNAADEARELRNSADAELAALAEEEYKLSSALADESYRKLRVLLLPRDPNDERNVVIELRAGTGGEEACLFASDLYRMYSMYCSSCGYKMSLLSENRTDLGGYRRIEFLVEGDGAYSRFKFESGTHEVKRVPVTEANGRIQTSTATVAVMPEAEEVDVEINPADIIFDTCKSSGAGGQHINKTDSAVRLTHVPTGIVVECQQERSQFQNRDRAMQMLRTILYDRKCREQKQGIDSARRSMVGSGDRSERIRIYRYKDNLVRDMRLSGDDGSFNLENIINGNISAMIDTLIAADTAEKLKNGNETD